MSLTQQPRQFSTTRWSLVVAAGQRPSPQSREALGALIRQYWCPLYAYVRRTGKSEQDADDLTQAFFARLIAKNDVSAADQRRGRFRAWLKASLENFLANEFDYATAKKRGGGERPLSLEATDAEGRLLLEPADDRTPEQLYERRWTITLLERVLQTLGREWEAKGRQQLFGCLVSRLADESDLPFAELGRQLGMEEGTVRQNMLRLRIRYRELLLAEIVETLEDPAEQEAELRGLLASLT